MDLADYRAEILFILLAPIVFALGMLVVWAINAYRARRKTRRDFPAAVVVVAARKITGKGKITGPAIIITSDKGEP